MAVSLRKNISLFGPDRIENRPDSAWPYDTPRVELSGAYTRAILRKEDRPRDFDFTVAEAFVLNERKPLVYL